MWKHHFCTKCLTAHATGLNWSILPLCAHMPTVGGYVFNLVCQLDYGNTTGLIFLKLGGRV